jgi:hypothetical protein
MEAIQRSIYEEKEERETEEKNGVEIPQMLLLFVA